MKNIIPQVCYVDLMFQKDDFFSSGLVRFAGPVAEMCRMCCISEERSICLPLVCTLSLWYLF